MKNFFLIILLTCLITSVKGQGFTRGSLISETGLGYGSYRWFSNDAPSNNDSWFVPLRLIFNAHERIGITTLFQYNRINNRLPYRNHSINIGIGPTLHLVNLGRNNLSVSFIVGYSNLTMRETEGEMNIIRTPGVSFQGAIENRFWLTESLGAFASLSYGGYHYVDNLPEPEQLPFRITGLQGLLGVSVRLF